uniref:hypothetical protein n=1 Tax=Enterococcus faecalis TaxID=1351 RepID=UPI001C533839
GLVRGVVPRSDLVRQAEEIASQLGGKQAAAFADNKRWMNQAMKVAIAQAREEHARHRARA